MYNNIRKFRFEKAHMNIFDFSDEIGLSVSYLVSLENGMKDNPSYNTIVKLLKIFDCTFEELFPGATD